MIKIKNWETFQHYRDRNPPWIKLHRQLLNDRNFFLLDGECVKTLVLLWMLAAETKDGELPAIEDIAFRLRLDSKVLSSQIVKLNHWLIDDASNMQADCKQDASELLQNSPPEIEAEERDQRESKSKRQMVARDKPAPPKTDGSLVWEAYSSAYEKRYGALPVRNAKTNALCARFVELVGADSAPEVATYYLTSRNAWYVQKGHNLESLVADAGKLHTEWKTGQRVTQSQAREGDRLQGMGDLWKKVIAERGEP